MICNNSSFFRSDNCFLSIPPITLSTAFSNSYMPTESRLCLAAIMAASLHMLEISAPLNPGVKVDIFLAYSSLVLSGLSLIFFKWTLNISVLSFIVGNVISIYLSNLPGLRTALSNISAYYITARTITISSVLKPSISTSN